MSFLLIEMIIQKVEEECEVDEEEESVGEKKCI